MKYYIESSLSAYNQIFPNEGAVVEHMFAILGNGVDLDNKGYLSGNYRDKNAYEFPEPQPLAHIYPWSDTERFQPFRELAGCRDVGFKEAAKYFIECVKLTPDSVEHIEDWKKNINVVEDVLLNTPTIEDEYESSDNMEQFLAKLEGTKKSIDNIQDGSKVEEKNSVTKQWFFDVQWSDCPSFVEDEVRQSWSDRELGNDNYFWKAEVNEELFEDYPNIYFWLKHKGVSDDEKVIVHWWW